MIPIKLIAAGIGVSLLFFAAYKVYDAGKDSVQAKWDAERIVQRAALDAATEETYRIDKERAKLAKEIDETLKPKLAAVTADAKSLARRLSLAARQASGPLPEPTEPVLVDDGASGGGSRACTFADGVGQALEDYFGASARDSARLNAWIEFYRQLQESQPENLQNL